MKATTPLSDAAIAYYDDQGRAVFRASAVNKCTKALVASLLGHTEMSPPAAMQKRFDAGHEYEQELLDHVAKHGFVMYGGQGEYDVPLGDTIIIRGHIDSLGSHREHGVALVEAKTMSPAQYEKWLVNRWRGSDLFAHYADQTSIYWEAIKPQLLVMVVGRKAMDEDGNVTGIDAIDLSYYFEPPASINRLRARLAKVLAQAKTGIVPDACDSKDYPCPFVYLHDEEVKEYAPWSEEEELDALAIAIRDYLDAQAAKAPFDKAMKEARKRIDKELGDKSEAQSNRYVVEYTQTFKRALDEDAMTADGIDVGKYEVITDSRRINVKELG
jgi:hypothetical protein